MFYEKIVKSTVHILEGAQIFREDKKLALRPKPMPLQAMTESEPMLPLMNTKTRGLRFPNFGAIRKIDTTLAAVIATA